MNNTPVSITPRQEKVLKYYYAPSIYFNMYKGNKYIQRHKIRFTFRVNNKTNKHEQALA